MKPFLYIYGVGGLVFLAGMIVAFRQGYLGFRGAALKRLLLTLGVFVFFLGLQAFLQFAPMKTLPPEAYAGGAEAVVNPEGGTRGHPLDYGIIIFYFIAILAIGAWSSRRQKTTKDFFFGGQRFAWWLIAFSMIATTIGSYSFVKYSSKGFEYGLSSSQTYLNDWIWFPLLMFGWLPILYFSRVTSIPEYFGRRFNSTIRFWATVCILVYLVGYVGVNLFTMGKVMNHLLGWNVFWAAALVGVVSMSYVTAGGQTSVIMTDLFQGGMLLLTGVLLLILGAGYLGGWDMLWNHLPRSSRMMFTNFNEDPGFPSVGIFWQDGLANTAMFYFLNQGAMMRFAAARSLSDARKAVTVTVVVLMTLGACVVGGGGWVARALVHAGALPDSVTPSDAFYVAADFLSRPGVFGLILAALTAALMSTIDTLITAVSALVVNDVYRPYVNPKATDQKLLNIARWTAVGVALFGIALVPIFNGFNSIYDAHGAFTAAVTPPLVVTLMFSLFWKRFTSTAALWTLIGGLAAMGLSLFVPEVISPFAHGVPVVDEGEGFLSGMKQYKFMRACYGLSVCALIAVTVTWLTKPSPAENQKGLVWSSIGDALRNYKGSEGSETDKAAAMAMLVCLKQEDEDAAAAQTSPSDDLPPVIVSSALAQRLRAKAGDPIYLTDPRWWLGGLRSAQVRVLDVGPSEDSEMEVKAPQNVLRMVAGGQSHKTNIKVVRWY